MQWWRGKRVLVTGGSSGIGRAAALQLAQAGACVGIVARNQQKLDEALEELHAARGDGDLPCVARSLDVGDPEACRAAAPEILEQMGGLDVLINNAGVAHPGYIHEIPDRVFEDMVRINYLGTVYVTRAFLPHFLEQGTGRIANVSSMLGFMGVFGYSAYAASKFAVVGFSECLRQDLLHTDVKVTVVYPPDTDTPQYRAEEAIKPKETKAVTSSPLTGLRTADDVAKRMLDGIAAGRFSVVPGFDNQVIAFAYRHAPGLVRWIMDMDVRKAQRP